MHHTLNASFIGQVPYQEAWNLQREWAEIIETSDEPGVLLLLEHPPTFTTGRRDSRSHFLTDPETLTQQGFEIVHSDRGGLVTYHGPGQLVGYPILHLGRLGIAGVAEYVALLEDLMQAVCRDMGLETRKIPEYRGVFAAQDKIGAVGVHVDRQISTHGFALNVAPNLEHYRHITACGLADTGVTSLAAHGIKGTPLKVANRVFPHMARIFKVNCLSVPAEVLLYPPRKEHT
jgi:lipoyl(octanoyl) transferase